MAGGKEERHIKRREALKRHIISDVEQDQER